MTERVGVRELRQNLSRYLQRVKAGEGLVVTERGHEVARLIPSGANADRYAELGRRYGATIPIGRLTGHAARRQPRFAASAASGRRPELATGPRRTRVDLGGRWRCRGASVTVEVAPVNSGVCTIPQ